MGKYSSPGGSARNRGGRQRLTEVGDEDYDIESQDRVVALVEALTSPRTWTLPLASTVDQGTEIILIDLAGGADSTNDLTITTSGSDDLNGGLTLLFEFPFGSARVVSDGDSNWTASPPIAAGALGLEVGSINAIGATFSGAVTAGSLASPVIEATGSLRQSSSGTPFGYDTGAGGSVTQNTNKSTAVTVNTPCGQITTDNAALGAGATATFTVNNSKVTASDTVIVNVRENSGHAARADNIDTGTFQITLTNTTGGSLSQAVKINFAVINSSVN